MDENWLSPSNLISLGTFVLGALGIVYTVFQNRRSHTETQHDALSNILSQMARTAQCLQRANECRRKIERIKSSFDPKTSPQAIRHVNAMFDDYGRWSNSAQEEFRTAESLFVSRLFRFPDSIVRMLERTQKSLSDYGKYVNDGLFDRADLKLAEFRQHFSQLSKHARGWRFRLPFSSLLQYFSRPKSAPSENEYEFELDERSMQKVMDLVQIRATTHAGNAYAVHPPRKLLDKPELAMSDSVIDELRESKFSVVFQDGKSECLSFAEMMALTYNLLDLKAQIIELEKIAKVTTNVRTFEVTSTFAMKDVMQPEIVKVLLSKIEFSDTPSEESVPSLSA